MRITLPRPQVLVPSLLLVFALPFLNADVTVEVEPNDTPSFATPTVGMAPLDIAGSLSSPPDNDYFTFDVANVGVTGAGGFAVVSLVFEQVPASYSLQVLGPSGELIFSFSSTFPTQNDFNPSAIGGTGRYLVRIFSGATQAIGPYRFTVTGAAGPNSVPPTVRGTAVAPTQSIPSVSAWGLLTLSGALAVLGSLVLRYSL